MNDKELEQELAELQRREEEETFHGHTVADLRRMSEKVFSTADWRDAWETVIEADELGLVQLAALYFHGDASIEVKEILIEPDTIRFRVRGNGYQCW